MHMHERLDPRFKSFITAVLMTASLILYMVLRQQAIKYSPLFLNRYNDKNPSLKYILQWYRPSKNPFLDMKEGLSVIMNRGCPYSNCFVTSNRDYFGDYKKFDAIVFQGPDVTYNLDDLPELRSLDQKFVYANREPPDYYPVCSPRVNDFFNWTWTFKLNSDASWKNIAVRDSGKKVIGPSVEMHWLKIHEMAPVKGSLKRILQKKTKAAAFLTFSKCQSNSDRETEIQFLEFALKQYGLTVDVYGPCGSLSCPGGSIEGCHKIIQRDYYFYLAYESSIDEDYVTRQLLRALENNAVPVVYGGANYTRFMPDGIYLNARELRAERLAAKMNELILNPDLYAEYFRWKNHYSYHSRSESVETDDYCGFCALLNNEKKVKEISTYPDFRKWWNNPYRC